MRKMKLAELTEEINYFSEGSPKQTDEQLTLLEAHYMDMFLNYCGVIPDFVFKNNKGQIYLKDFN